MFYKKTSIIDRVSIGVIGFTLFELLIVLVIIGLIAALVLPKVGGNFDGLKLKAEAKRVASALRYARSQAVSENLTLRAHFNSKDKRLTVVKDENNMVVNGPWRQSPDEKASGDVLYELAIVDSVDIITPDAVASERDEGVDILFYPSGGSTGGILFLKTGEKKTYRLVVDNITGSVKVLEDGGNAEG